MSNKANYQTDVELQFEGLIAFCFNRLRTYCKVSFLTDAGHHQIVVSSLEKDDDKTGTPLMTLQPETVREMKPLWLYTQPIGREEFSFSPQEANTATPFPNEDQNAPPREDYENDFRRVINFAGEDFLNSSFEPVEGKVTHLLNIVHGSFSAKVVEEHRRLKKEAGQCVLSLLTESPKNIGQALKDLGDALMTDEGVKLLGNVASRVACNIDIPHGHELILRVEYGPIIFRYAPTGAQNFLRITNLPPSHHEAHSTQMGHDNNIKNLYHFLHYYEAFKPKDRQTDNEFFVEREKDQLSLRGVQPNPPCNCIRCGEDGG